MPIARRVGPIEPNARALPRWWSESAVIISDRKQFVFLHNPKSAGTSIRRALLKFDDRDDFYWKHHVSRALGRKLDKAHMAADDFRQEFPADFELLGKYFVFMFVRDPYDRAVSAYNEMAERSLGIATTPGAMARHLRRMNDFLSERCTEDSIRYDFDLRFFVPQHAMCFQGGACLADYIGRFEDLDEGLSKVTELAKLPDNAFAGLAKANRRNRDFQAIDLLTPESIARINMLYERDFTEFGYAQVSPGSASLAQPGSQLLAALKRRFKKVLTRRLA